MFVYGLLLNAVGTIDTKPEKLLKPLKTQTNNCKIGDQITLKYFDPRALKEFLFHCCGKMKY